jgi:predicted PurR-regulated permease PerM
MSDPPPPAPCHSPDAPFIRKVMIVALIAVLILVLWRVSLVLILTFGGVLVAIALRSLSDPLRKRLRIPAPWALLIATLCFCAAMFGIFDLFGTLAAGQFYALFHRIPAALEAVKGWLGNNTVGREMLNAVPEPGDALSRVVDALPLAGGILGGAGEAILVLAVGIYFAADPQTYIRGLLRLLPPTRRGRARQTIDAMGASLRKWLLGMSLDMLFLGLLIFIGMTAIGMPYAFALAVLSGVAVFVPYIGPAIALIPGMLLALAISPPMALYAGIVYLVALTIEGNISQPMLQRWAVSIPPVVNLLAILVFSPLFGIWGAVLATPLSVALWVLVRMIYVEDVLKDGSGHAENQS